MFHYVLHNSKSGGVASYLTWLWIATHVVPFFVCSILSLSILSKSRKKVDFTKYYRYDIVVESRGVRSTAFTPRGHVATGGRGAEFWNCAGFAGRWFYSRFGRAKRVYLLKNMRGFRAGEGNVHGFGPVKIFFGARARWRNMKIYR